MKQSDLSTRIGGRKKKNSKKRWNWKREKRGKNWGRL